MKVYVVHPGASFATADVFDGLMAGLRAQEGVDLYAGRLDTIFGWYESAMRAGIKQGVFRAPAVKDGFRAEYLSSAHITQHILEVWPDLILVVSGGNYHTSDVRSLRKVGFKVAVLLTESPYFLDAESQIALSYDAAFTCDRACVPIFRNMDINAHYLAHAYNPVVHSLEGPKANPADVFFCGSLFDERKRALDELQKEGVNVTVRGNDLVSETPDVVPNWEVAAHYRASKTNLNMHRTTTSHGSGEHIPPGTAQSLNPRAYEIPACGGFMLCDDSRAEGWDVFGEWFPTYRAGDVEDLGRQVRYWLKNDARREETARAMHEAVKPHSWVTRAKYILETL